MTESYSARDYIDIGYAAMHRDNFEEAIASFEKALELDANTYEAMNHLGMIALGSGDNEKAVGWWMKSIETEDNAEAHYNLGFYYIQKQAPDQAKPYLKKAVLLQPHQKDAVLQLAQLEIQEGNFLQAEELIEPLLDYEVVAEQAHLMLSQSKFFQKDAEKAKHILVSFLERQPDSLDAMHQLSRIHVETGAYQAAEDQYDELLQKIPYNLDLVKEYGTFLCERSSAEKSVEVLQKLLSLASADWELQLLLGTAQEKAQLLQDAIVSYANAINLNPNLTHLGPKIEALKANITQQKNQ